MQKLGPLLLFFLMLSPVYAALPGYAYWRPQNGDRTQLVMAVNGTSGCDLDGDSTTEWIYGQGGGLWYNSGSDVVISEDNTTQLFKAQSLPVVSITGSPLSNMPYFLPFDRSETNAWDLSGYSNNGTLGGTPTQGAEGKLSNAYNFTGGANIDYVDLTWPESTDWTIALWGLSDDVGNVRIITSYVDWGSNANGEFMLRWDSSRIYLYVYKNGGWQRIIKKTTTTSSGVCNNLCAKKNGDSFYIYVDGSLEVSGTLPGTWATSSAGADFKVGTAHDAVDYGYDGTIDHYIFFNETLTDEEITQLYNGTFYGSVGNEVILVTQNFTFDWQPITPHVESNVTFNVTYTGYEFTNFWYDFDDGSNVYHSTGNVSHIWNVGGTYNVTVTGLNASTNYTIYDLVTVTEPTIQVWLQDVVSGDMLTSFTVSVWNNTNTTNFTTTGYYVEWDYHEGPKGNVTIGGYKRYYNITNGAANITNTTDVNVTLTGAPAIVILRPRDASYPQLTVPVEIRIDNLTESRWQGAGLDDNIIVDTVTCPAATCTNTSTSGEHYGQVFEYILTATGTGTGAGDIIRAYLYIKDEDGDTQLIDWANKSGGAGTETVNRILYLSEAGYEIRTTGGTLVRSSTDILDAYPFRVYTTLHASADGAGESSSASSDVDGATPEFEFYIPYGTTLGQSNIVIAQKVTSPFAYVDTSYHYQKLSFTIYETSVLNYTVYLFRTGDTLLQTVYVIDNNNEPIADAYVQAYGTINASELISSSYSDGSGKVELPLKATQEFYILASASGYDAESVTVYPSASALYITLAVSTDEWTGPFSGISYSLDCDEPLQTGQNHNITLTISDSEAGLLNFSLKVWINTTNVNSDISTSATGGVLFYDFTVPDDAYGYYTTAVEFYRTFEGDTYYFEANQTFIILTTGAFDELRTEIGKLDALSQTMVALIALGSGFLIGPFAGLGFGIFAFLIGLISEGLLLLLVLGMAIVYGREVLR